MKGHCQKRPQADMNEAVEDVRRGQMSFLKAGKMFNVSHYV